MPYIPSGEKMENNIAYIGDENLNKEAKATINRVLADNEPPVALAGFDFETKVIAITRQRVMIASENDGLVLNLAHGSIQLVRRDGRTLVIQTQSGIEHRYRFAKDDTVQELMQIAAIRNPSGTTNLQGPFRPREASRHRNRRRAPTVPHTSLKGSGSGRNRTG